VKSSNIFILLSAGSGTRFQAPIPKQYTEIDGSSMLNRALRSILKAPSVEKVAVVVSPDHGKHLVETGISQEVDSRVSFVHGGTTRGDSIRNALHWAFANLDLDSEARFIVHDSCRPFISETLVEKFISAPSDKDAWVTFQPPGDAIAVRRPSGEVEVMIASDGVMALNTPIAMSIEAGRLVAAETDQAFSRGLAAFLIEKGLDVGFIETDGSTRKITYSYDLSEK
jgi:2-C-methyl-D-erythritol 4-phosphate cytidylyltransferase